MVDRLEQLDNEMAENRCPSSRGVGMFVYRWDDILQDFSNHREKSVPLQMRLTKKHKNLNDLKVQITDRSTKAFICFDGRVITELDLQTLTISDSEEIESDDPKAPKFGDSQQVSTDGHHVAFFYNTHDRSDPDSETAMVQINDLIPSDHNAKYIKLIEPIPNPQEPWTFSADLSVLYTTQGIYDVSSVTTDMTTTRLFCSTWDASIIKGIKHNVIFSSCNRYLCVIGMDRCIIRIFEICRLKKIVTELKALRKALPRFWRVHGLFHPSLPILLLSGEFGDEHWAVEIDLSTLKMTELTWVPNSSRWVVLI